MTERPLTGRIRPGEPPPDRAAYERAGGYQAMRRALLQMTPEGVVGDVTASGLRGRGGAGFGTGQKWSFVPKPRAGQRRYLVANADEMEPGTFKDRLLLEGDPHQMVEAIIVSAYALQATDAYIFVRGEYKLAIARLNQAIGEATAVGYLGRDILGSGFTLTLHLHASAGRYICGEETAMLNALEGKRAIPRAKPPLPQTSGLFGHPTVVNNVETICNIPHIIGRGVDWYRGLGVNGEVGTKIFGVSGRVKHPGSYELPMGTPMRDLIEDHGGGMRAGYSLRALLPGGASTGFLLAEDLDIPMSVSGFAKRGHRLGTGTAIVLDDRTCPVGFILNLQHFFAQESCGWCAPCRDGLPWVEQTLNAIETGVGTEADIMLLSEMTGHLSPGRTFCALAPGAMASLQTGLAYFREDFERHIGRSCAWH